MVEFKGHQLYFQGNGRISLFKRNARLLEYEEKWLSQVDSKITTDGKQHFNSYKKSFKRSATAWKFRLLYWGQRKPVQIRSSNTDKNCRDKAQLQS